jgi:hypothetical protein
MNERTQSDERIESALRSLPLRTPSQVLDLRVELAMSRRAFPWRSLAAAACFGAACFWFGHVLGQGDAQALEPAGREAVSQPPAPAPEPAPGLRLASAATRIQAQWPIAQAQLTYNVDAGPPVRATVQDAIERSRWVDPETNRDIELTRPVRQVVFSRQDPQ